MTNKPIVKLVSVSNKGLECCAAAARLSTTPYPAFQLAEERKGGDKDRALVRKVLASGHQSVIEHYQMSFSLDHVSVLAEQFLIECRLCAFTVKSRRYVDFENAGWYVPNLDESQATLYNEVISCRFRDYTTLTQMGIPFEDARFVLPYCFYSSLYISANAREMALLIGHMLYGRGQNFPEIRRIGEEMARHYEEIFPGVLGVMEKRYEHLASEKLNASIEEGGVCRGHAEMIGAPQNAPALLDQAIAFTGRIAVGDMRSLVLDARPRELEMLNYVFSLTDVSLACVTHIARHRIQSPMFGHTLTAVNRQRYILPRSIVANTEARAVYEAAFAHQKEAARRFAELGLKAEDMSYLALSGLTVNLILGMNARELLHFMHLRTCARAQWEIRDLAGQMLSQLRKSFPALFELYGPSCQATGWCPEGRLSCGRAPVKPAD